MLQVFTDQLIGIREHFDGSPEMNSVFVEILSENKIRMALHTDAFCLNDIKTNLNLQYNTNCIPGLFHEL